MKFYRWLWLFLFLTTPALAATALPEPKQPTGFDIYWSHLDQKFSDGAVNFIAGWTEIIRQPIKSADEKNAGHNKTLRVLGGSVRGIGDAIADTAGGFFNALTAIFPHWKLPLPDGGVKAENITGGTAGSRINFKTSENQPDLTKLKY